MAQLETHELPGQIWVTSAGGECTMLLILTSTAILVSAIKVKEGFRGRGLSIQLCKEALRIAAAKGLVLESGPVVTSAAIRLATLARKRGHDVRFSAGCLETEKGIVSRDFVTSVYQVRPKSRA